MLTDINSGKCCLRKKNSMTELMLIEPAGQDTNLKLL